jgi:hypothetical protein
MSFVSASVLWHALKSALHDNSTNRLVRAKSSAHALALVMYMVPAT